MLFLFLFILHLLPFLSTPNSIAINFNQSGINLKNREWAQIKLLATGAHPPFLYSYTFYPKSWKYVNQSLYIPIKYFQTDMIYPCRIKITDSQNNEHSKLFGVNIKNNILLLQEQLDHKIFDGINSSEYIDYEDSKKIKLEDLRKNQLFLTEEQIFLYRKKVDKLNSGVLTKSIGSGLTQFYSQSSNQPTSLVQALNPALILRKNQGFNQSQQTRFKSKATLNQSNPLIMQDSTQISEQKPSIRNLSVEPEFSETVDILEINSLASKLLQMNPNLEDIKEKIKPTNIDNLIYNEDRKGLLDLIKQVSSTLSFTCGQKTLILNDILARVDSANEMKQYVHKQVQSVRQAATKDLNTIIFQINQLKSQETTISTEVVREKLLISLSTVQGLYAQFNDIDTSTVNLQTQLGGLNEKIMSAQKQVLAETEQLTKQKQIFLMLNTTTQNIEKQMKENQIEEALKQKQLLELQKQFLIVSGQIVNILKTLEDESQRNKMLEYQLKQRQYVKNNSNYAIEQLAANISFAQSREKAITYELSSLNKQISWENSRFVSLLNLFDSQLRVLSEFATIKASFEKLTNSILVKCSISRQKFDQSFQTTFPSYSHLDIYIKRTYSCELTPKSFLFRNNIHLQVIKIADQKWEKAHSSFNSLHQNTLIDKTNYFNCQIEEFFVSGSGVLLRIAKFWILIENNDGHIVKLYLFYCTRIQSLQSLPRVGQTLFWRGKSVGEINQYYVERLTCF